MKKGFTLIELLAVILILGIIALIAIPQVTNVIDNASKGAAETSAEHYVGAVNTTIGLNKLDSSSSNDIKDGILDISTITVDMTGETPTSGTIFVRDGSVVEADLEVNGHDVRCDSKGKCTAEEYVYYNKIITDFTVSPVKADTTVTKPNTSVYLRYRTSNNELLENPDACINVDKEICFRVNAYEESEKKLMDYVNFDKSVWTYAGNTISEHPTEGTISMDTWILGDKYYNFVTNESNYNDENIAVVLHKDGSIIVGNDDMLCTNDVNSIITGSSVPLPSTAICMTLN